MAMASHQQNLRKAMILTEKSTKKQSQILKKKRDEVVHRINFAKPSYVMMTLITREDLGIYETENITNRPQIAKCIITAPYSSSRPKEVYGTLMDPSMGPISQDTDCVTCNAGIDKCPGHFGAIHFRRRDRGKFNPIFHPLHMKRITWILQSICSNPQCVRVIHTAEELKFMGLPGNSSGDNRLRKIAKLSAGKTCKFCNSGQPEYNIIPDRPTLIGWRPFKKKGSSGKYEVMYPNQVYDLFNAISPEDEKILGFGVSDNSVFSNRPRDFIRFGELVTPHRIRPSKFMGDASDEDDFTKHYSKILAISTDIYNFVNNTNQPDEVAYLDLTIKLSEAVKAMISPKNASANETMMRGYKQLLDGKTGLFRKQLDGRPVDFSARTVAGPGAQLRVDEIGVPREFQSILTRMEKAFITRDTEGRITSNIEELQEMLKDGKVTMIKRGDRLMKITEFNRQVTEIQVGDEVSRWMKDGDLIYANRNPSLHKHSFLSLKAKLVDANTIHVNQALLGGFNGDYDGDEFNLHFPQTYDALAEMEILTSPKSCLLSQAKGGNIVAAIIDGLTGSFLMTQPKIYLDSQEWMSGYDALTEGKYDLDDFFQRCKKNNVDPRTSRSLYSLLFPPDMNYQTKLKEVQTWQPIPSQVRKIEKVDRDGNVTIRDVLIPNRPTEIKETNFIIRDGLIIEGAITSNLIGTGGKLSTFIINYYGSDFFLNWLSDMQFLTDWFLKIYGFTVSFKDCINLDLLANKAEEFQSLKARAFDLASVYQKTSENELEMQRRSQNQLAALDMVKEGAFGIIDETFNRSNLAVLAKSGAKGSIANAFQLNTSLGMVKQRGAQIPATVGEGVEKRTSMFFPVGCSDPRSIGFCESNFGASLIPVDTIETEGDLLKVKSLNDVQLGLTPVDYCFHATEARADMAAGKVDTGKTGYVQRRLVKHLEDVVIAYDGTVRENNSSIIQFLPYSIAIDPGYLLRVNDEFGEYYTFIDFKNFLQTFLIPDEGLRLESTSRFLDEMIIGLAPYSAYFEIEQHRKFLIKGILRRQIGRVINVPSNPVRRGQLIEAIRDKIRAITIEYGFSIGIIAGTSIGEEITQKNLKLKGTIGSSNSSNLLSFISSIDKLLRAVIKLDSSFAYVYFEPFISFREATLQIKNFKQIFIRDLADGEIGEISSFDRSWLEPFLLIHGRTFDYPDDTYCIRLKFNKDLMYSYDITLEDVAEILIPYSKELFISPNHIGVIDMIIPGADAIALRSRLLPKIMRTRFSGIPGIVNASVNYFSFISLIRTEKKLGPPEDKRWEVFQESGSQIYKPANLLTLKPLFEEQGFIWESESKPIKYRQEGFEFYDYPKSAILRSTRDDDISPRVALSKAYKPLENFDRYNCVFIETQGSNIPEILNIPGVDKRYTYSTNVREIHSTFGVDASMRMFLHEFGQGYSSVLPVHLETLVSTINKTGSPTPVSLEGAESVKKGALTLASYESALKMLMSRAPFNDTEILSVSSSIMLNQPATVGTGFFDVVIPEQVADQIETIKDMFRKGENPYPEPPKTQIENKTILQSMAGKPINQKAKQAIDIIAKRKALKNYSQLIRAGASAASGGGEASGSGGSNEPQKDYLSESIQTKPMYTPASVTLTAKAPPGKGKGRRSIQF